MSGPGGRATMRMSASSSRRVLLRNLAGVAAGGVLGLGACRRGDESGPRRIGVHTVGSTLGIHTPAIAAWSELLGEVPGYGPATITRLDRLPVVTQSIISGAGDIGDGDILTTLRAIRAGLSDLRILGPVLALSVVFQCLVAAVNAALFSALGVPVGFGACLIFTPMIFALTMLPLSLSGFGLREAAYAYFFALVGVPMADAVAVSLAFFGLVAVISLPGAPLFLLSDRPLRVRSRALKPEA